MADQQALARRGLTLSRRVLRRLTEVGIFAQSQVSLEHQHLAKRYVVRGIESGGAVRDFGRYVTFCGPDGEPLPYLHPIDASYSGQVAPVNYSSRSMNLETPNMAEGLRWRTALSFAG